MTDGKKKKGQGSEKKTILWAVKTNGSTIAVFESNHLAHEFCKKLNAFSQETRDALGGRGLSNIFYVTFA